MPQQSMNIHELPVLRDTERVFIDRCHAGEVLADMLSAYAGTQALVLSVAVRGVPIAVEIAQRLGLPLDVVTTPSTRTRPSPTPVTTRTHQGRVQINEDYVSGLGLGQQRSDIDDGEHPALQWRERWCTARPYPDLRDRPVIVVDDGLASGSTLRSAVATLRQLGASELLIAAPTGYRRSVESMAREVEAVYCPNLRGGLRFCVADAYEQWSELGADDAGRMLQAYAKSS